MKILLIILVIGMLVSCSDVETPTGDVIDVPEDEVVEVAEEPEAVEEVPETIVEETPEVEELPKEEEKEATVEIQAGFFEPEELTISIGTTVTWINEDIRPHTVADTPPNREFYGSRILPGETYSHTFTEAGEYDYFDVVFYSVKGRIIVEE